MKLFIRKKEQMDADLGHRSKATHQEAFKILRSYLVSGDTIPMVILAPYTNYGDAILKLYSVDIEKEFFVYTYEGTVS